MKSTKIGKLDPLVRISRTEVVDTRNVYYLKLLDDYALIVNGTLIEVQDATKYFFMIHNKMSPGFQEWYEKKIKEDK